MNPARETAAALLESLAEKHEESAALLRVKAEECAARLEAAGDEASGLDKLDLLIDRAYYRGGAAAMQVATEELRERAKDVRKGESHLQVVR